MTDDLELKQLGQFIGTVNYYDVMGVTITDGIKYVMKNGYSWFITDAIVIIKMKFKDEGFLAVKLILKDDGAEMRITDGNDKTLYTQAYTYTDAKRELTLFYDNTVLILSGEY